MQTDPQKLPPCAIDAEESLLAHCLIHGADEVVDCLSPDDFYKAAHNTIFSAITDLDKAGSPIEVVTLTNMLRSEEKLDVIGGAAYLARLMDAPIPTDVDHYARIVKDKAILRRLISTANEIVQAGFDDKDAETTLDESQRKIMEIDYDRDGGTLCRAGDVLESVIESMEERKNGEITGIPTGISKLDYLLGGFQPTHSLILAGRPAMGKTALALNFVRHASVYHHIPTITYSLEMSREELIQRLIAQMARIDGGRFLTNSFSPSDWSKITDAAGRIHDAPIFIDDNSNMSYMDIRRSLRRMVRRENVGLAVIDYLQLVQGDKHENRTREIGSISRAVKIMAKEFKIPIILISQLSRKCEERRDKRPLLSDLRESGDIEQDANVVMFIYRDEVYDEKTTAGNTAEIIIRKHRGGAIGMVPTAFLKAYQRFAELA